VETPARWLNQETKQKLFFFFSKRGAQCHFKGGGAIQTLFSAGLRAVQQINKN